MNKYEILTDLQWDKLKDLFPAPVKRGRGKPHTPWRSVVNSVLYVLLSKAKWGTWPKTPDFASKSAAHRWFLYWEKTSKLDEILAIVRECKPECQIIQPKRRYHNLQELSAVEESSQVPLYLEIETPQTAVSGPN